MILLAFLGVDDLAALFQQLLDDLADLDLDLGPRQLVERAEIDLVEKSPVDRDLEGKPPLDRARLVLFRAAIAHGSDDRSGRCGA